MAKNKKLDPERLAQCQKLTPAQLEQRIQLCKAKIRYLEELEEELRYLEAAAG